MSEVPRLRAAEASSAGLVRRQNTISIALLIAALSGLAGMGMYIGDTFDTWKAGLATVGEKYPTVTCAMLAPGPMGWWAILASVGALLIAKEILIRNAKVRIALNLLAGFLTIELFHVYVFAMMHPFVPLFPGQM